MSDQAWTRGIYYFDVAAAVAAVMIVLGRYFTRELPGSPAVLGDLAGWWCPLLAAALLVGFRRRAYTQATPWGVLATATLAVVAIGAIFWRMNLMVFIAAAAVGSLVLLAGLVLRSKRISEPLSRLDLFALIAMVGGISIGVAATELVVRLAPGLFSQEIQQMLRADPSNYGIADPYIGYLHKPNNTIILSGRDFYAVHHVDAVGFRNPGPWPDRAEIVVVGDSLTFGYGVPDEEAWPYLLARAVSPSRVVNLGLIGAGPQQYLRLYERFGAKLRPKLLVVGVFPQNDFWDAEVFDRWEKSGLGGNFMVWRDFGQRDRLRFSLREPIDSLSGLLRWSVVPAFRSSHLYNLLRALRGGVEGPAPAAPRIVQFSDGSSLQLLESDFLFKSAAAQPGRREFRLMLRALQEINSLAAQHGAHALMVLQPGKEQVYLPLLGETRGDPTVALRAALDRSGIEYLDLAPAFRERAAAGERLFFEVDGHPNSTGYALTAQLVQAHITENASRYGLIE